MTKMLKRHLYLFLGGLFFLTGLVGIFLPLLPTTPFIILAASLFAKSSPYLHQKLLNNRWIGKDLQCWAQNGTIQRRTKRWATWVTLLSFSLSIGILWQYPLLQLMLVGIAAALLFLLWRVPEA